MLVTVVMLNIKKFSNIKTIFNRRTRNTDTRQSIGQQTLQQERDTYTSTSLKKLI